MQALLLFLVAVLIRKFYDTFVRVTNTMVVQINISLDYPPVLRIIQNVVAKNNYCSSVNLWYISVTVPKPL